MIRQAIKPYMEIASAFKRSSSASASCSCASYDNWAVTLPAVSPLVVPTNSTIAPASGLSTCARMASRGSGSYVSWQSDNFLPEGLRPRPNHCCGTALADLQVVDMGSARDFQLSPRNRWNPSKDLTFFQGMVWANIIGANREEGASGERFNWRVIRS